MQPKTINGINYNFYYLKGTVVGKEKTSRTDVYGGGGHYNSATGYTTPVSISSTTTIKDIIYVKDNNGKEHEISLTNWDISGREGHEMLFIWAVPEGSKYGTYLAIKNMTTDRTYTDTTQLKKLTRHSAALLYALFCIPAFLVGYAGCSSISGPDYRGNLGGIILAAIVAFIPNALYQKAVFYKSSEYQKFITEINSIVHQVN